MGELYRCPHCQGIIGEVEWDDEDEVTLAEPLQTPAEAACDPGEDADTCVIVVEDCVLEE